VRITQAFYLGRYPVTQAQFATFRPEHENGFPGDSRRPVEQVTWDAATEYCVWLNDLGQVTWPAGLEGFRAQLPTEAQWEYGCRAGTETEYHMGDGEIALSAAGWYDGNSGQETHPVGMKEPNAYGLYDMHGNVWEWCADAWNENAYKMRVDGVCDPEVTTQSLAGDVLRVVRGGSWYDWARFCRAAYRGRYRPANRGRNRGFRVCLFPGPCRAQNEESESAQRVPGNEARRQAAAQLEGTSAASGIPGAALSPTSPECRPSGGPAP
jgi:formylglycine-generating enzyme required for sulfatase activity